MLQSTDLWLSPDVPGRVRKPTKAASNMTKLLHDSDAEQMHDWKTPESRKGGRQSQRVNVGESLEEGLH